MIRAVVLWGVRPRGASGCVWADLNFRDTQEEQAWLPADEVFRTWT